MGKGLFQACTRTCIFLSSKLLRRKFRRVPGDVTPNDTFTLNLKTHLYATSKSATNVCSDVRRIGNAECGRILRCWPCRCVAKAKRLMPRTATRRCSGTTAVKRVKAKATKTSKRRRFAIGRKGNM